MATTIQLDETTLQVLKEYKKKINASSYDEVIRQLLNTKNREYFGILKENPIVYAQEDKMRFKNE